MAGCWDSRPQGRYACREDVCATTKPRLQDLFYCCCDTPMCNRVFSNSYIPPESGVVAISNVTVVAVIPATEVFTNAQTSLVLGVLFGASVLCVIGGFMCFQCFRRRSRKQLPTPVEQDSDDLNLAEAFPGRIFADRSPLLASDLTIIEKIARGEYGEVFKATVKEQIVAVKKFVPDKRRFFLNECRIFTLPFMDHDALVKFLAATEVRGELTGLVTEYWLVLEYHPKQTLLEYLKLHTIDTHTLSIMAYSLAGGLAYLHSEFTRDGVTKPGIVHRDLNSRNILVRADMRLCICDMGFALALNIQPGGNSSAVVDRSENSQSGSVEDPQLQVDNHVGTVRYMAPEVLEGSLNLRDSSAALRQVDVYAFGLITWELATRCAELYQGSVPEYQLPFQQETGHNPTFAVMQVLVGRKRARPLFSDLWNEKNVTVRFLKETMEECWDADADARLTANCVEERLKELALNVARHRIINNLEGLVKVESVPACSESLDSGVEIEPLESTLLLTSVDETMSIVPVKNVNEIRNGTQIFMHIPSRVQPHQGRNPCAERNIKPESSEEMTSSGNILVGKKSGLRRNPSPPDIHDGAWSRMNESVENTSVGIQFPMPSTETLNGTGIRKNRQKKVSNALAAEQNNRSDRNGFLGLFRKSSSDSNNLLRYRAVPVASSQNGMLPSAIPLSLDPSKCNIRTAATLLPQMIRRDAVHEGSNSTQLTCLSPSPSTSGHSPPCDCGEFRSARFSAIRDAREIMTSDVDDVDHGFPPPSVLIYVPSQPVICGHGDV